jgi:hypothetical protein
MSGRLRGACLCIGRERLHIFVECVDDVSGPEKQKAIHKVVKGFLLLWNFRTLF